LDILQKLVYEEKHELFANLKDQNVITDVASNSQNQKSHIAVEKASSSSGKGEWRTYSAHFLLII